MIIFNCFAHFHLSVDSSNVPESEQKASRAIPSATRNGARTPFCWARRKQGIAPVTMRSGEHAAWSGSAGRVRLQGEWDVISSPTRGAAWKNQ
jgi:hypothetical protein